MFGTTFLASIYQKLFQEQPPTTNSAPTLPPVNVHSLSMRLDMGEGIQNAMANGSYELEQTAWAIECLSAGDRFVDVGASFGYYTGLASTIVGRYGQVFAFEPSPVASKVIETTIAENRLTNVRLIRAAVGNTDGYQSLFMPVNSPVHSPSFFFSDPAFIPTRVPMMSLDRHAALNDGRAIKLIKIDVEGFEPNVIMGMHGLIRKGLVKNIFCEFNSGWLKRNNAITPSELLSLITSHGFIVHAKTKPQILPEV